MLGLDKKTKIALETLIGAADAGDGAAMRQLEDARLLARCVTWLARRVMELEVRQGIDSSTPDELPAPVRDALEEHE